MVVGPYKLLFAVCTKEAGRLICLLRLCGWFKDRRFVYETSASVHIFFEPEMISVLRYKAREKVSHMLEAHREKTPSTRRTDLAYSAPPPVPVNVSLVITRGAPVVFRILGCLCCSEVYVDANRFVITD